VVYDGDIDDPGIGMGFAYFSIPGAPVSRDQGDIRTSNIQVYSIDDPLCLVRGFCFFTVTILLVEIPRLFTRLILQGFYSGLTKFKDVIGQTTAYREQEYVVGYLATGFCVNALRDTRKCLSRHPDTPSII